MSASAVRSTWGAYSKYMEYMGQDRDILACFLPLTYASVGLAVVYSGLLFLIMACYDLTVV